MVGVLAAGVHGGEERRGRQLFLVPGDDQLPAAVDAVDGVAGQHLGRLVEDHGVEGEARWEVLGHRQRAHQEVGLEQVRDRAGAVEQVTDRHVFALFLGFPLDDGCGADQRVGAAGGAGPDDGRGGCGDQFPVQPLEVGDQGVPLAGGGRGQPVAVLSDGVIGPGFQDRAFDDSGHLVDGQAVLGAEGGYAGQPVRPRWSSACS